MKVDSNGDDVSPADEDDSLELELRRCFELLREYCTSRDESGFSGDESAIREVLGDLLRLRDQLRQEQPRAAGELASTEGEGGPEIHDYIRDGRLAKYPIREFLRIGGQAVTARALDPDLGREVVLKLSHSLKFRRTREEILKEGRALARVRSRYVVRCHSVERLEEQVFLVLEYVAGESLSDRIDGRPLDVKRTLEIMEGICEGMEEVHACGLLHRDLKPANIILDARDGDCPRIIDFGLAAHFGSEDLARTRGTLAYMAPEQARGATEDIDARTDVFGLGAVMYEMLTGRPPYDPDDPERLLEAARRGRVDPIREVAPTVPAAVGDVCLRCLAVAREDRYRDVTRLRAAIRNLRSPRRRGRAWFARSAQALACMLLVAGAIYAGTLVRPSHTTYQSEWFEPEQQRNRPGEPNWRRDFYLKVEVSGGRELPGGGIVIDEGERIFFRVEADTDSYLGIFSIEQDQAVQLFPNQAEPDALLEADRPRTIPGKSRRVGVEARDIEAVYSGRTEFIHVFASTQPWHFAGGTEQGGFQVFGSAKVVDQWIDRGFKSVARERKEQRIAEQVYRYRVVRRSPAAE